MAKSILKHEATHLPIHESPHISSSEEALVVLVEEHLFVGLGVVVISHHHTWASAANLQNKEDNY